jgi:hypothetical protein
MAFVSLIGTESWSDYGAVVLQVAILDTLLSVEEKLGALVERWSGTRRARRLISGCRWPGSWSCWATNLYGRHPAFAIRQGGADLRRNAHAGT